MKIGILVSLSLLAGNLAHADCSRTVYCAGTAETRSCSAQGPGSFCYDTTSPDGRAGVFCAVFGSWSEDICPPPRDKDGNYKAPNTNNFKPGRF